MKPSTALLVFMLIGSLIQNPASAQTPLRPAQAGEIELQSAAKKTLPQESVYQLFITFPERLDKLVRGSMEQVPWLNESEVLYLNGVYLFCTVRKGPCPWLLDTLLETDIINARLSKTVACPLVRSFWKLWIENEMQRRLDYHIPTAHIRNYMQFRRDKLPRYLTCGKTVEEEIKLTDAKLSDSEFFKTRYAPDTEIRRSIKETADFLSAIQAKKIDVFTSMGITVKAEKAGGGSAKAKREKPSSKVKKK